MRDQRPFTVWQSKTRAFHRGILGGCALVLLALCCGQTAMLIPPAVPRELVNKRVLDIALSNYSNYQGILVRVEGEGVLHVDPGSQSVQPLALATDKLRALAPPACVVQSDDSAFCEGQLTPPTLIATAVTQILGLYISGSRLLCILTTSGAVRCGADVTEESGKTFAPLNLDVGPLRIQQLAGTHDRLCGRAAPDTVRCWTLDASGAATAAPEDFRGLSGVSNLAVQDQSICAVLGDGQVSCWGEVGCIGGTDQPPSQPTLRSGLTDIAEVQVGYCRGCARKREGTVLCWGYSGLFADQPNQWQKDPVPVPGLPPTSKLIMGTSLGQDCAITTTSRELYCWGDYISPPTTTSGGCGSPFFIPGR